MKKLEQSLNKPSVVLVVGVVAVALNILLYFGYFLPRTTPLVEQIYSIGTSLPEAISDSDSDVGNASEPESGSGSDPEAGGTSGSETGSDSDPEAGGTLDSGTGSKSDPGANGTSGPEADGEAGSDSSSSSAQDSPSGSPAGSPQSQHQSSETPQSPAGGSSPPPELPPLPTPSQQQYQ